MNRRQRGGRANHHPRGRKANHRHTGRWRDFIQTSFNFILNRGPAAPPKEGRGRKHHPKEAEGGSTTKRRRGSQRKGEGTTAQKEGEVHLSFFVVLLFLLRVGVFFPVGFWVVLIFLLFPIVWCRSLFFQKNQKYWKRIEIC